MLNISIGKKSPYFGIKTFTYYIPSPPPRKTGYQEKEFDQAIESITKLGFEIINIKTSSHSNEEKSGMWVVCLLGAKNKRIFNTKIEVETSIDINSQPIELDADIIHE